MTVIVRATLEPVDSSASQATVRTHTMLVDRSVAKGGTDRGPAGGEYLLVALGGCFSSHLLAAIRARSADVGSIRVAVSGTMDGTPERFTAFTLDVATDGADSDLARKVVTIAGRGCQVVNTLSQSAPVAITHNGSPVDLKAVMAGVLS